MTAYAQHVSTKATPQSESIPGRPMVPNSAGGFAFEITSWDRLDRFLVLGSEGNTYYCTERELTIDNAKCIQDCLAEDGLRTVARIVEISKAGRAPKNIPAVFCLALAASFKGANEQATRRAALDALPHVCRIPTDLFAFVASCKQLRGHGHGLNRALKRWYLDREPQQLSYHVTKYQSRDGWSHRDVLRLAKPKGVGLHQDIFHWVTKGWPDVGEAPHPQSELLPIWAFERAKRATSKTEIVRLILEYNLSRECIPTQWLTEADVWSALLEKMPMTALVRNLATMTRVGVLAPMSAGVGKVLAELANQERLRKSRIHPIAVLTALKTYAAGRGERGRNTWTPVPQVIDALDGAFYSAFANIEPTGRRWLLALDVSGSMESGSVAGISGLTPRVASAAMALVTAATEPQHAFVAFTSGGYTNAAVGKGQWASMGYGTGLTPLSISPRQRLDDVCKQVAALPMGGTDCALPMLYATEMKIPVDAFVVYTDNETWAGGVHPCQALQQYRQKMGIGAKLIVVGMTATKFTIADPNDAGMMDVVGFDAAAPVVMADFAR